MRSIARSVGLACAVLAGCSKPAEQPKTSAPVGAPVAPPVAPAPAEETPKQAALRAIYDRVVGPDPVYLSARITGGEPPVPADRFTFNATTAVFTGNWIIGGARPLRGKFLPIDATDKAVHVPLHEALGSHAAKSADEVGTVLVCRTDSVEVAKYSNGQPAFATTARIVAVDRVTGEIAGEVWLVGYPPRTTAEGHRGIDWAEVTKFLNSKTPVPLPEGYPAWGRIVALRQQLAVRMRVIADTPAPVLGPPPGLALQPKPPAKQPDVRLGLWFSSPGSQPVRVRRADLKIELTDRAGNILTPRAVLPGSDFRPVGEDVVFEPTAGRWDVHLIGIYPSPTGGWPLTLRADFTALDGRAEVFVFPAPLEP